MILPAKSIKDMPAVWSACLLCGLLYCPILRVLCGLLRWSYAVVFALLFQVSKWVLGCVVLEAVRVVHVIICKCVVQRGVACHRPCCKSPTRKPYHPLVRNWATTVTLKFVRDTHLLKFEIWAKTDISMSVSYQRLGSVRDIIPLFKCTQE